LIFLDTSAQGERVFGRRRDEIYALISRQQARTSQYVWEEFRCTYLRDAVLFHRLLSEEGWDVARALERADTYPTPPRSQARIRQVFRRLIQSWAASVDDLRGALENLIEGGLEDRFWSGLDREATLRETDCRHGGPPPRREGPTYRFRPTCTAAKPPPCGIRPFWETHAVELAAVADGAEHLPDDLAKAAETAAAIRTGRGTPHGNNCHKHLSDCVIAAEASPDDHIFTTNLKHFRPICALIGRKLYEPAS